MKRIALLVAALALSAAVSIAQSRPASTVTAHVLEPTRLEASSESMKRLQVPSGFRISTFAEKLENPRMMAVAEDGSVYVTRRELGDCVLLKDADGDGRAEAPIVVARRPQLHGVAVHKDQVFLVTVKDVYVATRKPDGTLGELKRIIDDLPDGGQHPNRTLSIGPDGMLYISVGSTCNACDETSPEHATILRAKPDGSSRTIFASGLRNTIGFDWHPETRELFGMDHGIDFLGDDEQKEELNRLTQAKRYGWPYIYADAKPNPQRDPPAEIPYEQWARMSENPVLLYTAHAAPMQMAFYEGTQFPGEYRHDAFVAMHGSWNRQVPSGYEVVRVRFEKGKPTAIEPFATGFVVQQGGGRWGYVGRPAGLAMARDGSLLVSDDANGVIYRIAYETARSGKE